MTSKVTFGIIISFLFLMASLSGLGFRFTDISRASNSNSLNSAYFSVQSNSLPSQCYVTVVYDGDTIGCDFNNNHHIDGPEERVRLLGIDAPETSHSAKNKTGLDEPYAQEAKKYLDKLAWHHTVYLQYDVKPVDKYNRKLAFVSLDIEGKEQLNAKMLESGFTKLLFIPPNQKYFSLYTKAESNAQRQHLGLWQ